MSTRIWGVQGPSGYGFKRPEMLSMSKLYIAAFFIPVAFEWKAANADSG